MSGFDEHTMAERKILLVDGPGKGKLLDFPRSVPIRYVDFGDPQQLDPNADLLTAETVMYWPVQVIMFGHLISVGTCQQSMPADEDLFDLLVSRLAKEAVRSSSGL